MLFSCVIIYVVLFLPIATISTNFANAHFQSLQGGSVNREESISVIWSERTRTLPRLSSTPPTIPTCKTSSECGATRRYSGYNENCYNYNISSERPSILCGEYANYDCYNILSTGSVVMCDDSIYKDCFGLSSNGSLVLCGDSTSSCLCRTPVVSNEVDCTPTEDWLLSEVCAWSASLSLSVNIPCELFQSTTFYPSACTADKIDVPVAPDRAPTFLEACSEGTPCEENFTCVAPYRDQTLSSFPQCKENDKFSLCICVPIRFTVCGLLIPCPLSETCVTELSIFEAPICMSNKTVKKSLFHVRHVFIPPRFAFTILFALELSLTFIKLAFQGNKRRGIRLVSGCAFFIESLAGISNTVLQLVTVILVLNFTILTFIGISSLLIFISELGSVLSEAKNIKARIFWTEYDEQREQKQGTEGLMYQEQDDTTKQKSNVPCRVNIKWVCFITSGMSLVLSAISCAKLQGLDDISRATTTQYKICLVVILSTALVYLLVHTLLCVTRGQKMIERIISALLFAALSGVVILWALFHPSDFPHLYPLSIKPKQVIGVSVALFTLPIYIMFTAFSAYNLRSFKDTRCVTEDQVNFIETAIFGTIPQILIIATSTIRSDDLVVFLMVAVPQIAVLLAPVLVEYVPGMWKSFCKKLEDRSKQKQQDEESNSDLVFQ